MQRSTGIPITVANLFENQAFCLALLTAIALAVGAIFAANKIYDPFLLFRLARVEAWLHSGHFTPYRLIISVFDEQRPFYEFILATIAAMTSLNPVQLAVLPIGAVMIPLSCYFLAYRVMRDGLIAVLIALCVLLSHSLATVELGTFVYVWSTAFFYIFLGILWIIVGQGRSPRTVLALAVMFFLTEFTYPSSATWMIFATAGLMVARLGWLTIRRQSVARSEVLVWLTLAMTAYFLMFDRTFNETFLNALGQHGAKNSFVSTIDQVLATVGIGTGADQVTNVYGQYAASVTPNRVGGYVVILQYLLLAVGFFVALGRAVWNRVQRGYWYLSSPNDVTFAAALVMAIIGHTLSYALYGHFTLRVAFLLGPLLVLLLLRTARCSRRLLVGWGGAFALVSAVGLASLVATQPPQVAYEATGPVTNWLLRQERVPLVSTDLNLYGDLLVHAADRKRAIELQSVDVCVFQFLVGNHPYECRKEDPPPYVVLNRQHLDQPMSGLDWVAYGPPARYLSRIRANPNYRVAYRDAVVLVLKRTHAPAKLG